MRYSTLHTLVFVSCLNLCTIAQAQVPGIRWQHCYGGSRYEQANQIIPTNDGGYWVVGQTNSSDGDVYGTYDNGSATKADMLIMKISRVGAKEMVFSRGGANEDVAYAAAVTADGGLLVTGYSFSSDNSIGAVNRGSADAWVLKLDYGSSGLAWSKTFGGAGYDAFYGVTVTPDGGCLLTGETSSTTDDVSGNHGSNDAWLVKLDRFGQKQWQKCLGGSGQDVGRTIKPANDGGYILGGYTESSNGDVSGNHGGGDIWLVALTETGTIRWQRCYGGSGTDSYIMGNVDLTPTASADGYQLASAVRSADGDVSGNLFANSIQAWTARITNTGQLITQRCLGGSSTDVFSSIVRMPDGGFTLAGFTLSSDGDVTKPHSAVDADIWLVRLDATGQFQGQRSIGSSGLEAAHGMVVTAEGTVIVAGNASVNDGDVAGLHSIVDAWVVELGKPAEVANAHLVACYPFRGDPRDLIGNHHGTIYQATLTTDRFGTPNSAYAFNGNNSYIDLGPGVFRNNNYAMAAWVKSVSPFTTNGTVLSVGNYEGDQAVLLSDAADGKGPKWFAVSSGQNDSGVYITSFENTKLDVWHHVVMTRSGKTLRFYINGRLVDERYAASTLPDYTASSGAAIGGRTGFSDQYFKGIIDDVQIYDGALVEDQVMALYQQTAGCPDFPAQAVDLSLSMVADTRTPVLSQPTLISLLVRNNGPLPATRVQVVNRLPTNYVFVSSGSFTNNANTLSAQIDRIDSGAVAVLTYIARPTIAGHFVNAAEIVYADQPDSDSQPGTGTADGQDDTSRIDLRTLTPSDQLYVSPNPTPVPLAPLQSSQPIPDPDKADLSLSLSVNNRVPALNDVISCTLTVRNRGGLTASGVVLAVVLPAGLTFTSGASFSQNGNVLSVPVNQILVNSEETVTFQVRVSGNGMQLIKAEISQSARPDPDSVPGNGYSNGEDDTAQADVRIR